jgi:hypothetical protein
MSITKKAIPQAIILFEKMNKSELVIVIITQTPVYTDEKIVSPRASIP